MPIYEYECMKCGKQFSHLHRRLNEEAPACPDCGAEVKRKFSTFSASVQSQSCTAGDSCPAMGSGHRCCPGCCHNH